MLTHTYSQTRGWGGGGGFFSDCKGLSRILLLPRLYKFPGPFEYSIDWVTLAILSAIKKYSLNLIRVSLQLGDIIDGRDVDGCWYEAELMKVTKNNDSKVWTNNNDEEKKDEPMDTSNRETSEETKTTSEETKTVSTLPEGVVEDDGFVYHVKYEG